MTNIPWIRVIQTSIPHINLMKVKYYLYNSNHTDHVTSNQLRMKKKQHLYFLDPHEEMVKMASYYAAITVGCMRILGKQYKHTYILQ